MKITSFTLITLLTISSAVIAQTEKGRWTVGAQIGNFTYQDQFGVKSFSGSITPSAGYFVADGLVIGTGVPLSFNTQKSDDFRFGDLSSNGTAAGLAPFIRYYIGPAKLKPYLGVAYSYSWTNSTNKRTASISPSETTTKGYATALTPTAGVAYFFTRTLALNAGFSYNINHQEGTSTYVSVVPGTPSPSPTDYDYDTKTLSLGIGLLIFIGK